MANKKQALMMTAGGVGILVVAIICLNIISSKIYTRLDTTSDNIYSLSDGTKKILKELQTDVTIKFYFSSSLKNLPVVFKTYAARVEEVLGEYAAISAGKITLESFDPKPDTDDEEWARKSGIQPMRIPNGDDMYFGAVFIAGKKEIPLPYFDPRREEFLEYDLSEALVQIQEKEKSTIGILSSLPIMGAAPSMVMPMENHNGGAWAFVEQLRRNFNVKEVPTTAETIDQDVNVLLVFHPKELGEPALYAIDQFVMRGGRLIVAVDPFSRFDLASAGAMARMSGQMPKVSSDLKALFEAYGIEYDPQQVVGDLNGMPQVNAGGEAVAYPYFVNVRGDGISKKIVATQSLNQLLMAEGGEVKKAEKSAHDFLPVLQTSADGGGTANGMMAAMMGPADFARQMKTDGKRHVIGAFVTGEFTSAFPKGAPGKEGGSEHLSKSAQKVTMLVVADTDFLHDPNAVETFRFGPQTIVRPRNDNLAFILNAVEYLGGNENLISIRSRGKIARPFTKVEELQKAAQVRWQAEEERLSQKLNETQKKLNDLQGERAQGSRLTLSADQQAEIARFREEEAQVMRARREVRKNLREDIELLGNALIVANMAFVPVGVGIFGFVVFMRRSRRKRGSSNAK